MGVRVLRTPAFAPQAVCYCERLIATTRRECLDFLIPLSEKHLRRLLCEWRDYYNQARPHSLLGPNVPVPVSDLPVDPASLTHSIPTGFRVVSCRFSARSITIIGWHAPPDRAKPSDAALPKSSRRVHSSPLSTDLTPRKLREVDTYVVTDFV